MSERDELDAFGRLLIHEVRDRAINELLDQLTDGGTGPLPGELLQQVSPADHPAVRNLIVKAVDQSIGNFLFFLDQMEMDARFVMSGQSGTSLASISDGIHVEPFMTGGWIEKYSEFSEKEAGDAFER
jgi:hypothetical protein